jgi:hypothetical protein
MSVPEPRGCVTPFRRRCQYSVKTLMLVVTIGLVAISAFVTCRDYSPSSCSGCWANHLFKPGSNAPSYIVRACYIDDQEPTIAYFVRMESPNRFKEDPPSWFRFEGQSGVVYVLGQRVIRKKGILKLFVDDGSGNPREVVLDSADACRYFGRNNTVFTTYESCEAFFRDVIQKKYLSAE